MDDMDSHGKLQVVAKKLEKMLETALRQLKLEQKQKRESEDKVKFLTIQIKDNSEAAKKRAEVLEVNLKEKNDQIVELKAKIGTLEHEITARDFELDRREKVIVSLRKNIQRRDKPEELKTVEKVGCDDDIVLDVKVDQYQKRLEELIEKPKLPSSAFLGKFE